MEQKTFYELSPKAKALKEEHSGQLDEVIENIGELLEGFDEQEDESDQEPGLNK